ncbi:hypothetical protein GCM10017786_70510 [Amycolatopsis deserti]|uniref:Integral membrane protein n=1 Tax=Amycolatopsis deserti TaxID=185696 RepID=A0ABQ3JHK5_9PSEU|nr:hypothetical protein GCM10017786_70510 [Amycolatopsis deserti]
MLGFVSLFGGIAALVVTAKRGDIGTWIASTLVLLVATFVIIAGFAAMQEYNDVIGDLLDFSNSLDS